MPIPAAAWIWIHLQKFWVAFFVQPAKTFKKNEKPILKELIHNSSF